MGITDNTAPLYLPSGANNATQKVDLPRMPRTDRSTLGENGHWKFDGVMNPPGEKFIGFIYAMRNRADGKLYIGKKLYAGMGKLNKGEESNWKYYVSSNKHIDAVARLLRTNNLPMDSVFDFFCLEQYKTKGGLSFAEVWCLVTAEVPSNRDLFHNSLINGVSWKVNEKVTQRNRQRLFQFISGELE
jgi:hypothetical protein